MVIEKTENKSEQHARSLERMYSLARNNEYYRPRMRIDHGCARLEIDAREDFFHAAGALHGSVYFKALDDAAYFASQSLERRVFLLTVSFTIHLIRPVSTGALIAEGMVTQASQSMIYAESSLCNEKGKILAKGSGIFVKGSAALLSLPGYARD